MTQANNYQCATCGKVHTLTLYILTHLADRPQQKCDNCSAVHVITAEGVTLLKPGELKTPWLTVEPVHEGWYELKFQAGNESPARWWWSNVSKKFHFSPGNPAAICLTSIAGYRGLMHCQTSYEGGP